MSAPENIDQTRAVGLVPGAAIIRRIRRLLLVGVGSAVVYSTFMLASKGGCFGGVTATGEFTDADGIPTDVAPVCVEMTLGPNPVMVLMLAAVIVAAISRVLSHADGEAAAIRILDRAALAVMIITVASLIIAQVWFHLMPLDGIDGTGTYIWPFPFGSVDFQPSPMTNP
jgi:hypothetical protein